MSDENQPERPDEGLPADADPEKLRLLLDLMVAQAPVHVQDVARRCPGLNIRPSGDDLLAGEWEVTLVDRDNNDEVVVVGTFSSLQVRRPLEG